jgi:hypothetical protein
MLLANNRHDFDDFSLNSVIDAVYATPAASIPDSDVFDVRRLVCERLETFKKCVEVSVGLYSAKLSMPAPVNANQIVLRISRQLISPH